MRCSRNSTGSDRVRRLAISLAAALLVGPACASRRAERQAPRLAPPTSLSQQLDAVLATSGERAVWGVVVRHAGGEVIFQREPSRLLHPASNMKILTLAAAAERLGWDFRFETVVQATTAVDPAGTLRGDVVVVGGGDPTISRRHDGATVLAAWAEQLWRQGVRRVQGRIIGDGSRFGGTTFGDGWQWDDFPYGYSAPVNALSFNENTAEVLVAPGLTPGARATLQLVDAAAPLAVRNDIRTAASQTARRISLRSAADDPRLTLSGEVPLGYEPFKVTVAVADPPLYFARAFRAALVARGIAVSGPARSARTDPPGPLPPAAAVLVRHRSAPLSEMAATLMKVSQNLYAELLLHALGGAYGRRGTDALAETLAGWGVGSGHVTVGDGSGLTRYNLVTAATVDLVLSRMFAAPHRDPWLAAMPVAGQDGTLQRRLRGTPAEGRVFAKTGSIAYVRALSGYARTLDDTWVQFTILANNFAGPGAIADIDRATDQMVMLLVTVPAQRQ
jgi:D-alanyl-D-alanine carboxypeptidase/D-alanyl-D-alanine-endopeptidase (penicillin-binding protein 4)